MQINFMKCQPCYLTNTSNQRISDSTKYLVTMEYQKQLIKKKTHTLYMTPVLLSEFNAVFRLHIISELLPLLEFM